MNNQNNSSAPSGDDLSYEMRFAVYDFLRSLDRYAEEHGTELVPINRQSAMVRELNSLFATQPPADRVQGGLTDDQIVEVLHSLGIDTYPSKYGFHDTQVSATSIPFIRQVIERCSAILSRQSMMGGEVPVGCPDFTDDMLPPDLMQRNVRDQIARRAAAPQEQVERPSHETIISEGGKLVCTACGTSTSANAAATNGDGLHNAIMNLRCDVPAKYLGHQASTYGYKEGHRDARHAAAELVSASIDTADADGQKGGKND